MTIEQLPSGKYRAKVYLGVKDGKQIRRIFVGTNKQKVRLEAEQFEFNYKRCKGDSSDPTVKEAMQRYIDSRANILSPSTVADYTKIARLYFTDIHDMQLSKLTNERIQLEINKLSSEVSAKSVKNAYGLLRPAIKMFMPSLVLNIKLPQVKKTIKKIPSSDVIQNMLEYTKNTDMELVIILASFGLRRGEIHPLTTDDIVGNSIMVNKATVLTKDYKEVLKPTKNYLERQVPLPEYAVKKLKRKKGKIVDCTLQQISWNFETVRKNCDFKGSLHSLRHYYASVLHAIGVPDQYIAERGGWSNVKALQDIYQHSLKEEESKIDQEINAFFSSKFNI